MRQEPRPNRPSRNPDHGPVTVGDPPVGTVFQSVGRLHRPGISRLLAIVSCAVPAICPPGVLADGQAPKRELPEPVWYWLKAVEIPADNPLHKTAWDSNSPPDILVGVERNGTPMGETLVKEGWSCVYEKKFDNVFGFRPDPRETYTLSLCDYDLLDPNDSMLQVTVAGDVFGGDEVVIRERAGVFPNKESLVSVTLVRISGEEMAELRKEAGE
ncbi:MAG: hypothetical protein J0M04_18665 [Verrucomicrobia bacterium]|nr:hypothetical protein [Verrucomicrobiota bacterium]